MPKAYIFTIRRQIDDLLKNNKKWFTVNDIQAETGYSKSGIRDALTKSKHQLRIVRQRVDGAYYYGWAYSDRFISPCVCKLVFVDEDGLGIADDDDCPLHRLEMVE